MSHEYRGKKTPTEPTIFCIFICVPVDKFSRVLFAGTDPRNVSVSIPSPNGLVSSKSKIFIGLEKSLSRLFSGKEISNSEIRTLGWNFSRGSCIFKAHFSCILHRLRCTHFPSRISSNYAYTEANAGNYSILEELRRIFKNPYSEHCQSIHTN